MKKIMFVNFPVSGHVNPQINLCRELSKKNVKLIYYTFERYFPKFNDIENIELRKYPDSFYDYYNELAADSSLHHKFLAFFYVFYTLTEKVLPFIMDEAHGEKPDLVICDTLAIWGKIAARVHKVPMAFFFSSFIGDSIALKNSPAFAMSLLKSAIFHFPFYFKFSAIKKRIEKKYGKVADGPQDIMNHKGKFSIVTTSKEFQPGGHSYPDNVRFIGPAHVEDSDLLDKKDTIFISLGTIAFSDTYWDICIEAAKDLGYNVVVSFGGNKNNKVNSKNLSENVKVYENLRLQEYRDVLKKSVLFISHGGFNSISDSILYMTPLIICPLSAEQYSNGKIIEEHGCGIVYPDKKLEVNKLREKIEEVISNKGSKEGLKKYRESFLNSMGYKKVVEELMEEFDLYTDEEKSHSK